MGTFLLNKPIVLLFKLHGLWAPKTWSRKYKLCYECYTILILFSLCLTIFFELVHVFFSKLNWNRIMSSGIVILGQIDVTTKIISLWFGKKKIISIMKILSNVKCKPGNLKEKTLAKKTKSLHRRITIWFLVVSIIYIFVTRIVAFMKRELPVLMWLPYDVECNNSTYYATFWFLTITLWYSVIIYNAYNAMVYGILLQLCFQIDILKIRLTELPLNDESKKRIELSNFIHHHKLITDLSHKIQKSFQPVFIMRIIISTAAMATGVYNLLAVNVKGTEFITFLVLSSSTAFEGYLYSWFGNEVMLKSTEVGNALYSNVHWNGSHKITAKEMLIIMNFGTNHPIIFRTIFGVTLSLNTFCNMLKISYSVIVTVRGLAVSAK